MDMSYAFPPALLNALHVSSILGLILAIIGGTKYSSDISSARRWSQASVVIFTIIFIVQSAAAAILCLRIGHMPRSERVLIHAILLSVPPLIVRVIYSILGAFVHNKTFNIFNGSATTFGCMAVLPEFVVVVFYISAGFIVPIIPRAMTRPGPDREQAHQAFALGQQESGKIYRPDAAAEQMLQVTDSIHLGSSNEPAPSTYGQPQHQYGIAPTEPSKVRQFLENRPIVRLFRRIAGY